MHKESLDHIAEIKESMKTMIDDMNTESTVGIQVLKMSYGFIRR